MDFISKNLFDLPTNEIASSLKEIHVHKVDLSQNDIKLLSDFEVYDFALLGIIGLLIRSIPRILLGRKQPLDIEVNKWCSEIKIELSDLEKIADDYLEDNFSETPEYILREVMLNYPKDDFLKGKN